MEFLTAWLSERQILCSLKRHPFNPFDKDAFTEDCLRAVLEHDLKRKLENEEWDAFNLAFGKYWNNLFYFDEGFSPNGMFDSIKEELKRNESPISVRIRN